MKISIAAAALCLVASAVLAQPVKDGWVTFKTVRGKSGRIEHQINLRSIKQEGDYRSFWTRFWVPKQKQAQVFSVNEALFFSSQKFLVDCRDRRFGSDYVDSVAPKKEKYATIQTMHWASLDEFPAVAASVCGKK